jgi:hypothetical protein
LLFASEINKTNASYQTRRKSVYFHLGMWGGIAGWKAGHYKEEKKA